MTSVWGVVLFAIGIVLTIALHEWGHMTAARLCGMRVRRYFIGFGPTLFSFRRPEKHTSTPEHPRYTEYGLKAIPFGGFCDIAGMTLIDDVAPEDRPYRMVDRPARQRIFVLLGGILMNILIGVVIVYGVALAWGLPNPNPDLSARVATTTCVPATSSATSADCQGPGPAAQAGIQAGDVVVAVDGQRVDTFSAMGQVVQSIGAEHATDAEDPVVPVTVLREGQEVTVQVAIQRVSRMTTSGQEVTVGAVGVTWARPTDLTLHYNAATAVPAALKYSGMIVSQSVQGLAKLPASIPGVVKSIGGQERSQDSPMSVVGASLVGGELVKHSQWSAFFMLLASLNFFLALFNILPLVPLDGGHVAVVLWEKLRDAVRRMRGLAPAGPADYRKLMPLTVAVFVLLFAFGGLVMIADVVNPVRVFG